MVPEEGADLGGLPAIGDAPVFLLHQRQHCREQAISCIELDPNPALVLGVSADRTSDALRPWPEICVAALLGGRFFLAGGSGWGF